MYENPEYLNGMIPVLFLDGHARFMLTDTTQPGWMTRNSEWTTWFNVPYPMIPPQSSGAGTWRTGEHPARRPHLLCCFTALLVCSSRPCQ